MLKKDKDTFITDWRDIEFFRSHFRPGSVLTPKNYQIRTS